MITQTLTNTFKVGLLQSGTNFTSNVFRIALYSSNATLNADTSVYSTDNELPTGNGYAQGGLQLTATTPLIVNGVAYVNFADVYWPSASFIAAGALIYNVSKANAAVAVLNFGGNKQATGGNFSIQFPANTYSTAIIRIA